MAVAVPGVEDVTGLAQWMRANAVSDGAVPQVHLIAGGRSNLTYRLDFHAAGAAADGTGGGPARRLVLRRPPLGHVLPTAHDMSREYRVLSALHGTAVPVPRPLALCQDPSVIGAPFYLMEWVDGVVLRTSADAAAITPAQATDLSERFIEMLATIHGMDVEGVGLEGFGRPQGYLARQLARWQRQWELSKTREVPGFDELVRRLAAGLPQDGPAQTGQAQGGPAQTGQAQTGQGQGGQGQGGQAESGPAGRDGSGGGGPVGALVHGDFRIDNMLVTLGSPVGVAAVVDWEMSTLGDPLADLGLSLVYWSEPGEEDMLEENGRGGLTTSPGFLTRAQLAERYAKATGRDLSRLGYYMGFGCFKLAVVLEGIHARFLQHKTVGEGFERQGERVPMLVERAHRLLDTDQGAQP